MTAAAHALDMGRIVPFPKRESRIKRVLLWPFRKFAGFLGRVIGG